MNNQMRYNKAIIDKDDALFSLESIIPSNNI